MIAAAMVLMAVAGYVYYSRIVPTSLPADNASAQSGFVRRGDLTVSASGTGTIAAQTDASFGFGAAGQVTALYAKIGDQVKAGQVLAQLDDTLARIALEESQQALRELHSAASIATIQQEIATAQDSEAAAKDWLAYLISPGVVEAEDNLAIAQQELADAQAQALANPSDAADQLVVKKEKKVAYLEDQLQGAWTYYRDVYVVEYFGEYETVGSGRNRKQILVKTIDPVSGEKVPVIDSSVAELTTARNNVAQAQATILQDQAYLDVLNSDVIPDDAVGARITALYQAKLAVEEAKSALQETQLIAPISGTVTALDLNIGEQAGTSSVLTISQLSQPYTLDVYLDEADWSMAKVGNKAIVTLDLLPEQSYTGTVMLVYPELNPSFETSLVHLIITLDSSISQDLPAGTEATVAVVGGEAKGALLVSVDAIHKGDDGKSYVTVLQNGQEVEREVTLGLQNDTYAEVKSGLEDGETVVTE